MQQSAPGQPQPAPSVGNGWPQAATLLLLFLAGIVNFLDRSALSIANGSIRHDLHLSATAMGGLLSAFSLAYGLAQLPIGPLLDRMGAKSILGAGLAVWSAATILSGFVSRFSSFLALRILLGAGESPFFPASLRIIRRLIPERRRGRAMAAVNISTTLGQGVAPPLLTALMLAFGWRSMFAAIGCAGLALALCWWLFASEARTGETISQPEPPLPLGDLGRQWLAIIRQPVVWGLMLGFGGINYTAWFYLTWLPQYLQIARGISLRQTGTLAALPFVAGSIGMLLSGLLADSLVRYGVAAVTVHRRQVMLGMAASAVCTLLAVRAHSLAGAVACLCGALFFIHFAGTSAWGFVQAASPPPLVATVGSLQNFGSFLIASAAPLLTGWVLDRTHRFEGSFMLCAAVTLLGALSYLLLVREAALPLDEAGIGKRKARASAP